MKQLVWVTDIHLNFISMAGVETFCHRIADENPDAVLIGGDVGEAPDVIGYLKTLAERLALPIYFVLGNHDFYHGSIVQVRREAVALSHQSEWLRYLPDSGVIELTEDTCLIGHDAWGDGRIGDYAGSRVMLNDYRLIKELTALNREMLLRNLNALGDEAADYLNSILPEALARFSNVIVLLHVPPFREACWHEGRISDDEWLPHFTCQAVGEVLFDAMRKRPDRQMKVLCGHTHGAGVANPLPNLMVKTGGAQYGWPSLQEKVFAV
ncbi:MAG: phosphoesterase [Acidobacteria bacterium]|nr:phosphoesterase [Acidobacteriota bacterium]